MYDTVTKVLEAYGLGRITGNDVARLLQVIFQNEGRALSSAIREVDSVMAQVGIPHSDTTKSDVLAQPQVVPLEGEEPPSWKTTEAFGERPAYLAQYGLGAGNWTPGQRWEAEQYDPLATAFQIQQRFGRATGGRIQPYATFADYLPTQPVGAYGRAQTALNTLMGLTAAERAQGDLSFTGVPGAEGEVGLGALQNLLQAGLRGRWGRYGAAAAARQLPELQQQWQARAAGAEASNQPGPTSFLDYVKTLYGLW